MSDCMHLGTATNQTIQCANCSKPGIALKLFHCGRFGQCTPAREVQGTPCCLTCAYHTSRMGRPDAGPAPVAPSPVPAMASPAYSPQEKSPRGCAAPGNDIGRFRSGPSWSCGITTVPERRVSHLPKTIESLRSAGFDRPRLFVDGCSHRLAMSYEEEFRLPVTARDPRTNVCVNWTLAMLELFSRHPTADRYAIFQDDLITCHNVRPYLNRQKMQERTYWNLFCFLENDAQEVHQERTWFEGTLIGRQHPTTKQAGRGAVALVFSREAVVTLLSSRRFMERPATVGGEKLIDGGIVTAMNEVGYREVVHRPSLFQHMGDVSIVGHQPHPKSLSFPGEDFDALSLLAQPSSMV